MRLRSVLAVPIMNASPTSQGAWQYWVMPERPAETSSESPAFELGALAAKPLLVVLRVSEIIEQESLHVAIWGSADGKDWGRAPLFWFPQQFYRGVRPAALDLSQRPEVKFLQARWEVNRWGRGTPRPHFKFGVEIREMAREA